MSEECTGSIIGVCNCGYCVEKMVKDTCIDSEKTVSLLENKLRRRIRMKYDNLDMMTEEDSPEDIIEALIKDNKEALRTGDYTAADTIRLLMDRVNRLIEAEDTITTQRKKIEELEKEDLKKLQQLIDSEEYSDDLNDLVENVKEYTTNSHNCLDRPFGEVDIGFGRQWVKKAIQAIEDFEKEKDE